MRLNFGKFAGLDLEEIPTNYLRWLYQSTRETNADIRREFLERGELLDNEDDDNEEPAMSPIADRDPLYREMLDAGFKALAVKLHPDKQGGSTEAMRQLNAAREKLRGMLR
jgi:hypothetical protein